MSQSKYTEDGININTYQLIFNEKANYNNECSIEIETIDRSSFYDRRWHLRIFVPFMQIATMCIYHVNYFHIHKNIGKKGYTYRNQNMKFSFDYLEKYLKKILKDEDPYVRKEMVWDLKHNLRRSCCYYISMIIAANLKNSAYVTGLIPYEDGTTHLHSFVEYNGYVIDYTKNLIIPKEIYYQLLHVKELARINQQNVSEVYNLLLENRILNTARYLATFGNEIVRDLKKNPQLIKQSDSKPDFSCFFY